MRTEWTITVDHLALKELEGERSPPGTNGNAVGMVGPRGAKMTHQEICQHPKRQRFQMYDDDKVLYYTGFLVGSDLFAPLDDFGEPNAGCTSIRVQDEHGRFFTV